MTLVLLQGDACADPTSVSLPPKGSRVPAAGPSRSCETPGFASPPHDGFALISVFLVGLLSDAGAAGLMPVDRKLDDCAMPRAPAAIKPGRAGADPGDMANPPQVVRPARLPRPAAVWLWV